MCVFECVSAHIYFAFVSVFQHVLELTMPYIKTQLVRTTKEKKQVAKGSFAMIFCKENAKHVFLLFIRVYVVVLKQGQQHREHQQSATVAGYGSSNKSSNRF